MFGPKISTVFKSRWHALLWAGGILLTAYCSVPSPNKTKMNDAPTQKQAAEMQAHKQDVEKLMKLFGEKPDSDSGQHENPWAKTPN